MFFFFYHMFSRTRWLYSTHCGIWQTTGLVLWTSMWTSYCCSAHLQQQMVLFLQVSRTDFLNLTKAFWDSPKICSLVSTVPVSGQSSLAPIPSPNNPQAPWRWHSADTSSPISSTREVSLWIKLERGHNGLVMNLLHSPCCLGHFPKDKWKLYFCWCSSQDGWLLL